VRKKHASVVQAPFRQGNWIPKPLLSILWAMRSSDPVRTSKNRFATESSDVKEPVGAEPALTHISKVNAFVPKAVAGTMAADASAALLRMILPAGAAQGAEGDGVAMTDTDGIRDRDNEGERDGDAAVDKEGDADTAAHAAFVQANVCVWAAVRGRLASTCSDAPSSSSVCVAARSWQLVLSPQSSTRLVKTTDCSGVGAERPTCQNSLGPVPPEL
jgi:hypothetical protein